MFQEQDLSLGFGVTVEKDPHPGSQVAGQVTKSQGRRQKPSYQHLGSLRSGPDKQDW